MPTRPRLFLLWWQRQKLVWRKMVAASSSYPRHRLSYSIYSYMHHIIPRKMGGSLVIDLIIISFLLNLLFFSSYTWFSIVIMISYSHTMMQRLEYQNIPLSKKTCMHTYALQTHAIPSNCAERLAIYRLLALLGILVAAWSIPRGKRREKVSELIASIVITVVRLQQATSTK